MESPNTTTDLLQSHPLPPSGAIKGNLTDYFLKNAAERGNEYAALYCAGHTIKGDRKRPVISYLLATYAMGEAYPPEMTFDPEKKLQIEGKEYLRLLSESNYTWGILYHGICLLHGLGCEMDFEGAAREFERVLSDYGKICPLCFCQSWGPNAWNYFLGESYLRSGRYAEAVLTLEHTLNGKFPWGYYLLAICYWQGLGVEQNFDKALRLLIKGKELSTFPDFNHVYDAIWEDNGFRHPCRCCLLL
jgi:TPR repeat protein